MKCPTWDHVEKFYAHKLRNGNRLSVRVPFNLDQGDPLNIALELPNEMVIVIDGRVERCKPAADGKRAALDLYLSGMTDELRGRLETLVGKARGDIPTSGEVAIETVDADGLPVAQPADAPVDELIEPSALPRCADLSGDEAQVCAELEAELQRIRDSAAHEVLNVAWDADVAAIREGYFALTKEFHPDAYARYQSPAVLTLAQEIFIHVNKAYDRMRDTVVASGAAIAAGPALLPHDGWLTQFDDIGTEGGEDRRALAPPTPPSKQLMELVKQRRANKAAPASKSAKGPVVNFDGDAPPSDAALGNSLFGDMNLTEDSGPRDLSIPEERLEELVAQGRGQLLSEQYEKAQQTFTQALQLAPRERGIRALYHLAKAKPLIDSKQVVQAVAQLKAAISHAPKLYEARQLLDELQHKAERDGKKRAGLFKRFFK